MSFKFINYCHIILLFIILSVAVTTDSYSKNLNKSEIDKKDYLSNYSSDIVAIEQYLNNIKNISANFNQITSSGAISSGKFYLSRPGKMRVEYDDQPPIIIIVNKSVLTYYDKELDEISNLRTNTTPASFLTRKNISFSAKDIEIINVFKEDEYFKITIAKKNSKRFGEFSLLFSLNPINFIQMQVANDLDELVNVNLIDIDYKKPIANDLFILKKN